MGMIEIQGFHDSRATSSTWLSAAHVTAKADDIDPAHLRLPPRNLPHQAEDGPAVFPLFVVLDRTQEFIDARVVLLGFQRGYASYSSSEASIFCSSAAISAAKVSLSL